MEKHERTSVAIHKDTLKDLKVAADKMDLILERYVERVIRAGMKALNP